MCVCVYIYIYTYIYTHTHTHTHTHYAKVVGQKCWHILGLGTKNKKKDMGVTSYYLLSLLENTYINNNNGNLT